MTVYIIDRSVDAFLIYPAGDMSSAALCEDVDTLWSYVCDNTDEKDIYSLTFEAWELLKG